MKTNKQVNEKTEDVLTQVAETSDRLYGRVKSISFDKGPLDNGALNDMRLHLGYTRNYADLAKVRLQYMKYDRD